MATTTKTPEQIAQEQAAAQAKIAAKIAENKAKAAAKAGTTMGTATPVAGAPIVDIPATTVTQSSVTPDELAINKQYGWTIQSNWINSVQPKQQQVVDSGLNSTPEFIKAQQEKHKGNIPNVPAKAIPPEKPIATTPESAGKDLATEIKTNVAEDKAAATATTDELKKRQEELKTIAEQEAADKERQAAAQTAEYQRQIAEQNAFDAKYNSEKQRQIDSMVNTVQPLKDAEVAANKAAIDKANADQDAALSQAKIDTEAAQIQANYTYGKLGLTMGSSAVNATQQIATSGILKIAQIKADGAYKLAWLAKEMNAIEVSHQLKINAAIDTANDEMLAHEEKSMDKINKIQTNILLTDKEKEEAITKIKKDYINTRSETALKVYDITRKANRDAETSLKTLQDTLAKTREDARAEVARVVTSGGWDKLSPAQKQDYATKSGLSMQEIEGQKTTAVYSAVSAGIAAMMPGVVMSPASAKAIYDDAISRMAMGVPAAKAVGEAITANVQNTPEYKKFQAEKEQERQLKVAKIKAEIGKLNQRSSGGGTSSKANISTAINALLGSVGYDPTKISFTDGMSSNITELKNQAAAILQTQGAAAAQAYLKDSLQGAGLVPDINVENLTKTDDASIKDSLDKIESSTYYGSSKNSAVDALKAMGIASSEDSAKKGDYYYEAKKDDKGNVTDLQVYKNDGFINDTDIFNFE